MCTVRHGTTRAQNVGMFHHQTKAWARSVLADAESVRQNGTDGGWQHETPYKEELQLARRSSDLRFGCVPMRRAYHAGKSGDGAHCLDNFLGNGTLSVWASAKVRECNSEVEQEDEGRQSSAQETLRKGTDFLRRIIVPV